MGYDNWLMSGAYDNEDEEIYIEERVPELMQTKEYDPSDVSHMAEAISEASAIDQETIRDFIERKEWDKLGAKLFYMTYEYMEHFAEAAAQREVEQGL
jgi:predicted nucleotidyltransferase